MKSQLLNKTLSTILLALTLATIASFAAGCATGHLPMVKMPYQEGQRCVTYERDTCYNRTTGTPFACYKCRTGDVEGEPSDYDVER
jgi:hypothetical protein